MRLRTIVLLILLAATLPAQSLQDAAVRMKDLGLTDVKAFSMLSDLTSSVGTRLSGSDGYEKAVRWAKDQLIAAGADSVWLEPVMIPKWVRGPVETAVAKGDAAEFPLSVCALGGSIGTKERGVTGDVLEVRSFEELTALGAKAKGKIILFNRAFDATKVNTGEAYGGAVNQRTSGAVEGAKAGAVAVLVRTMTNMIDGEPHTGAMRYQDSIPKIPAAAVSTRDADRLSGLLKSGKKVSVTLTLSAKTFDDVPSFSVIGQITGTERPNDIIVVGGHLDSWDKGTGAHDDGAGVVHSIEAIRLVKSLGVRPKRTIRAVLYANEENGLRGGQSYAARSKGTNEKHLAAIESDAGGFAPRGFGVSADSSTFEKIRSYATILELVGADRIQKGGGGADISTLRPFGTALIGLDPSSQRYFDYHHSNHDTIDKVHPRELELGAIACAILAWSIAQNGL